MLIDFCNMLFHSFGHIWPYNQNFLSRFNPSQGSVATPLIHWHKRTHGQWWDDIMCNIHAHKSKWKKKIILTLDLLNAKIFVLWFFYLSWCSINLNLKWIYMVINKYSSISIICPWHILKTCSPTLDSLFLPTYSTMGLWVVFTCKKCSFGESINNRCDRIIFSHILRWTYAEIHWNILHLDSRINDADCNRPRGWICSNFIF